MWKRFKDWWQKIFGKKNPKKGLVLTCKKIYKDLIFSHVEIVIDE